MNSSISQIICFISVYSCLFFYPFKSSAVGTAEDFEIVRNPIQSVLNQKWSAPTSAPETEDFCTLEKFCTLLKPNFEQFYVYENPEGEKFPNLTILGKMLEAKSCFKIKIEEEERAIQSAQYTLQSKRESDFSTDEKAELNELRNQYRTARFQSSKEQYEFETSQKDENSRRIFNDFMEAAENLEQFISQNESEWPLFHSVNKNFYLSLKEFVNTSSRLNGKNWSIYPLLLFSGSSDLSQFSDQTREKLLEFNNKFKKLYYKNFLPSNQKMKHTISGELSPQKQKLKFSLPSPLYSLKTEAKNEADQNQENQNLLEKHQNLLKIFEKARAGILAQLNLKKISSDDPQIQWIESMIKRIQTVRLSSTVNGSICKSSSSPAHYEPLGHLIHICPWLYEAPESTLLQIIAHEFTHAIDPCVGSYPLLKEKGNYFVAVPKTPINQTDSEEISSSIPLSENPFLTTLQCLQSPDSIGVITRTQESHKKLLLKDLPNNQDPGFKEFASILDHFDEQWKSHQACDHLFLTGSQWSEAFADWMAAQVVAQDIQEETDPQKKKLKAFESTLLFLTYSQVCGYPKDSQLMKVDHRLKLLGCHKRQTPVWIDEKSSPDMSSTQTPDQSASKPNGPEHIDTHPESKKRITHILLQEPAIRQALGCETTTHRWTHCE